MARELPEAVRRAAVVGAGVIGGGWAALFLARGLEVVVSDPAPGAEDATRRLVAGAWPALRSLGVADEEDVPWDRLRFAASPEAAAEGADIVQESAPERLDLKRALFARLETVLRPDVVVASSTSGLRMTDMQADCRHPGRFVTGHPFNPPHLIPLVEVVGGERTDPAVVAWLMAFYRRIGKHPIHLKREANGHLANRLQAALWREAVHAVASGLASVEDVDAAIAHGPGLRWALMGPHLTFHLAGGEGGIGHFVDHLGPGIERRWAEMATPTLDAETRRLLVEGVAAEMGDVPADELIRQRDERLVGLLRLLGGG